jgi:hypothetical protein
MERLAISALEKIKTRVQAGLRKSRFTTLVQDQNIAVKNKQLCI